MRGGADVLRARVVWSAMCHAAGSEENVVRLLSGQTWAKEELEVRASEIQAYRTGSRTPSHRRLSKVAALLPEILPTLELPLQLLQATLLSRTQLDRIFAAAFEPLGIAWNDLYAWYDRADGASFLALALAFRRYQLVKDVESQWLSATLMFRAMPALCRLPVVRPHTALVHLQLVLMRELMLPQCCKRIEANWQEWGRQISDDTRPLAGTRLSIQGKPLFLFDDCPYETVIVGDTLPIEIPPVDWAKFGIQNNPFEQFPL